MFGVAIPYVAIQLGRVMFRPLIERMMSVFDDSASERGVRWSGISITYPIDINPTRDDSG